MEVQQALAELAEVRFRLASIQRFDGYSRSAAILSGALAVAAGFAQLAIVPHPAGPTAVHRYLALWLVCLFAALAINYGAIALWLTHKHGRQERMQLRTVGLTILPAIAIGGVLTVSFATHDNFWMLPGTWCMCYAVGLFASKAMIPRSVMWVAAAFGLAGASLLLGPAATFALSWWVMPACFGLGQILIGMLISLEHETDGNA